jgi:hypothetical protein
LNHEKGKNAERSSLSSLESQSKKRYGCLKVGLSPQIDDFFYPEYVFSEPMDLLTNPIRRCEMVGIYHGS